MPLYRIMINISFDSLKSLAKSARSVRRFVEADRIDNHSLLELVDLCRYAPSGRNAQPLKYRIVSDIQECETLFPLLKWAGYLTDWDGPEPGERPSAYIVQCLDTEIAANQMCDDGLQLELLTLGAKAMGLGGCIIKAFDSAALADVLQLHPALKPLHVYALGVPAEEVIVRDLGPEGDIRYWRDRNGRHNVPKRSLDELVIS